MNETITTGKIDRIAQPKTVETATREKTQGHHHSMKRAPLPPQTKERKAHIETAGKIYSIRTALGGEQFTKDQRYVEMMNKAFPSENPVDRVVVLTEKQYREREKEKRKHLKWMRKFAKMNRHLFGGKVNMSENPEDEKPPGLIATLFLALFGFISSAADFLKPDHKSE